MGAPPGYAFKGLIMENLMESVANQLGVKIGEKFCIQHYRGHLLKDWDTEATLVFMFTEDRGIVSVNTDNNMYQNNAYLADLILGRYKIEPYVEGCEVPKKDNEIKNIYEDLKDMQYGLTRFTNDAWLDSKKIFFVDDETKTQYESLQRNIECLRDIVCDTIALPIFKDIKKEKGESD